MVIIKSTLLESFIKDSEKAKKAIVSLLKDNNIEFVFIGGLARNHYASIRTTDDIDILVAKKDKDKVKNLPIGYIKNLSGDTARVFKLHDPEIKIEILYSGDYAGNKDGIIYKEPHLISNGDIISLKNLIEYKLSSGLYGKRFKDYGDIQDLIKQNNLKKNFANSFREDLKKLYLELWEATMNNKNFEQE